VENTKLKGGAVIYDYYLNTSKWVCFRKSKTTSCTK
jgi:hypothetical protein